MTNSLRDYWKAQHWTPPALGRKVMLRTDGALTPAKVLEYHDGPGMWTIARLAFEDTRYHDPGHPYRDLYLFALCKVMA